MLTWNPRPSGTWLSTIISTMGQESERKSPGGSKNLVAMNPTALVVLHILVDSRQDDISTMDIPLNVIH